MSDVFVSYKAEDRRRVKPLVEALEADGFAVWWDERIGGGASWRHTIEVELNAAKCVLVIWSKRSVGPDGTFVQDEATRAQQRHVYVPVVIDKVHPPLGFGESQALSLTSWKGDRSDPRYQSVLAAVRRIMGVDVPLTGAPPVADFRISRRTALATGAAGAVAVAGVGAWALLKPTGATGSDSIAVLPFANLSGDPGQAYFSDGIAEELRTALARLSGLKVVGRTSSEAVRNEDAETAARKLDVMNILTGSVRNSPAVVRVTAQLIDGTNGIERWSESYDRAPGDAIKIQTDIAENVARALSIALGSAAEAALTLGSTQNAAAHNFALQADSAIDEGSREGTDRALRLIDEALRLDPNYAEAHARKAIYLGRRGNAFSRTGKEFAQYNTRALQSARKALSLAPNLARGHVALASVYQNSFDLAAASAEYQKALQLAPGEAGLVRRYSFFVARMGRMDEALRLSVKAIELDPINPGSYENRFGVLFDARRYQEAIRFADETTRRSPELFEARELLGFCLLMLGKLQEAQQQFSLLEADTWERLTGEALVLARQGDRSGVDRTLKRMEEVFGDAASYQYGEIYAQLGERDRALAALERAWEVRDPGLINIRVDPFVDPLRGEPRFAAVVRKLNFPA